MERMLYDAVSSGKVEEVKEILGGNPTLDVNWKNRDTGWSSLHRACWSDRGSIVSIFLAHPDVDVNLKSDDGSTPFNDSCFKGATSCARLLLMDPRVNVTEPSLSGSTPLFWAAYWGTLGIIKWWISSGREMDFGEPGNGNTDAIGAAMKKGKLEAATLLTRFRENPAVTRHEIRVELGLVDELAAGVFALMVFVSDGLLKVTEEGQSTTTPTSRFFTIVTQLPLELQMVLSYRLLGSAKELITGIDREIAFKELAKR